MSLSFHSAADLLLPGICTLCGNRLSLNRTGEFPLCIECLTLAKKSLVEIEYPGLSRCARCGYPLTSEQTVCSRCRGREWSFDQSSSLFLYRSYPKRLIQAYKFDSIRPFAGFFADLIETTVDLSGFTLIPAPCRPASKRKRGWDQIEEIAGLLKKHHSVDISACLGRKAGAAQKNLSYTDRLSNLNGKIFLKKGGSAPVKVMLLDDVFTTGATLDSCATILKAHGSIEVRCITLAIDL